MQNIGLSVSTLIVPIYNLVEMDSSMSLKISGSFIISCLRMMAKIRPLLCLSKKSPIYSGPARVCLPFQSLFWPLQPIHLPSFSIPCTHYLFPFSTYHSYKWLCVLDLSLLFSCVYIPWIHIKCSSNIWCINQSLKQAGKDGEQLMVWEKNSRRAPELWKNKREPLAWPIESDSTALYFMDMETAPFVTHKKKASIPRETSQEYGVYFQLNVWKYTDIWIW